MLRKSKLTEIYKRFGFTEENTGNESIGDAANLLI